MSVMLVLLAVVEASTVVVASASVSFTVGVTVVLV